MKYEIGDKVRNGAGNLCSVQKSCLQCDTLVGDIGKGKYKCCMKSSCPGWKDNPNRRHIPKHTHGLYK